jgi:mono/diheme cytochrome c family protein
MKKRTLIFMGIVAIALALSCTSDRLQEETPYEEATTNPDLPDSASSGNDTPDNTSGTDPNAGFITYEADVKPILNQLCVACHNSALKEDGVDLSTYYLAKTQINDIIESMQEEEGEDDLMPPSGRVDGAIIQTLISWKTDGLLEGEATPDDQGSGGSDGNYTYTSDISGIIADQCILCHGPNNPAGGYDISTYQKTVDQIGLFIARIDLQTGQAGVMPPAGRMDEAIIQKIKDWVDQGMPE